MERLIRSRGLTKAVISRRARLLHNVYAWMRIVSESTNVLHDHHPTAYARGPPSSDKEDEVGLEHTRKERDSGLDSFLQLEPYQLSSGSDVGARAVPASSTVDIHMETAHRDVDNLHMQIYGVPETWLRLVSQITRLANALDLHASNGKAVDAEVLVSWQVRSSHLEDSVCAFQARYGSVESSNIDGVTPHVFMVRALSWALVIFYYRRIKKVHPLVLKDSVGNVIQALHEFDHALERRGLIGPGTAWPAFIAGAEAMETEQRQQIREWLDKAAMKSGWKSYTASRMVLEEIWEDSDEIGARRSHTWVDVCRRSRHWLLLC